MFELVGDLQLLFNMVSAEAEKLAIDEDGPAEHIAAATMYGRVLEITESCLILLHARNNRTIPLLVRPLLDAYIDLAILTGDRDYVKNMRANQLEGQVKLFTASINNNGENPFLEGLEALPGLKDMLDANRTELEKLKGEKRGEMNAFMRFEKAGMKHWYRSVFVKLCEHVHNNMQVLRFGFLRRGNDGLKIRYSKPLKEDEFCMYIDVIVIACSGGLAALFNVLGMENPDTMQDVTKAAAAVRAHWGEE